MLIKKITLLLFLMFIFFSFSAKAQTKKETIKWINSKLIRYGNSIMTYFPGNNFPQDVTYTQLSVLPLLNSFNPSTKLEEKDTLGMYINIQVRVGQTTGDMIDGKVLGGSVFYDDITNASIVSRTEQKYIKINYMQSHKSYETSFTLNWDSEPELENRMLKAFQRLVSLNSSTKEAF